MSVLVVGAGPVGLTLANLLGQAGVDATLVEANATTSDSPRAILIDDESFRTFAAVGLADPIREAVVYGTGARYYDARGRMFAEVRAAEGPFGFPKRSAFGQPALERILLGGLKRFGTVRTLFGTRLAGAERPGEGTAVQLETANGRHRARFDWVVGCDGGRSTVREIIGARMTGSSFSERWLILDTADDPDPTRATKFFCDPRRPHVSVPAPGGGRRYEFMALPGETDAELLDDSTISRLIAGRRTLAPADIVRKTVYGFHALIADRLRDGPFLLAGDAAHMMPPFAGQGMNSGIRDAANLAWKLALVEAGAAGPELLDSYDSERRAHAAAMIGLSVRLGRIVMATSPVRAAARNLTFRALGLIPPAKRWIAEMRWKPAPRAAAGAFVDPGRGLSGAMLPQPRVGAGDGGAVPLDAALGTSFALIGFGPAARALAHPLWDRLGCARVALTPGDAIPRAGELSDLSGALARSFRPHRGEVLLVRPDRFVAGGFRPTDEHRFAARFAALLGQPRPAALSLAA